MTGTAADAVDRAIRYVIEPGENVLAATMAMASRLPKWLLAAFVVLGSIWAITWLSLTSRLNFVVAMLLVWIPIAIAFVWLKNAPAVAGMV